MGLSKYYYNTETCRYEPRQTAYASLLGYAVLFTVTTVVIFAGILFLHSKLFLTEKGKALKKENKTFEKHFTSLQHEVDRLDESIALLKEKNAQLHEKLFDAPLEVSEEVKHTHMASVLLADAGYFTGELERVKTKAAAIIQTASSHNNAISHLSVNKKDKTFLLSVPSVLPVEQSENTKLVSGFGIRVNPFHKGNYNHPGVDFAAARGTAVMATANGVVIKAVNNSTLQAGYGNYVDIQHANGLVTRYAHLDNVTVRNGQEIEKGKTIGTVGMTGGSVAPHLHYEIIRNGKQVDPVPYLLEGLTSDQHVELQKLATKKNQSLD